MSPDPAGEAQSAADTETTLTGLAERMRRLASGGRPSEGALSQLAGLEVAHEELQVAEEELRVQQEQITQLLAQHELERRWRNHLSSLVPIGLFLTDGYGALLEANPTFAGQLRIALPRLRGKPLSVYLAPDAVPAFRTAVRELASGRASEHRSTVTLQPRETTPRTVELFGFTEVASPIPSAARVQWVMVPAVEQGRTDPGSGGTAPEPPVPVESLVASFAQLSALSVASPDRERLLSRMAALVRGAVPDAGCVSITLGQPRQPQRLGTDSVEAQEFDGRQLQADEGPCFEAYDSGETVVTGNVTTDDRWPRLARLATGGAVRSVLALPVREEGGTTGVLNVYSGERDAFSAAGRRIAELAAAAVAGVLQNVAEREAMEALAANLEKALTSRAVIDQAKGVLMARLGVSADDAFARLVTLSSRLNVKVRDLARLIVEGDADTVIAAAG